MNVVVTGIGLVSALGSLEVAWERLLAGETAIGLQQPFAQLNPVPLALIGERPTFLEPLTQRVVAMALKDAELSVPLLDCGVVIGSSRGNQGRWEQLAAAWLTDVADSLGQPSLVNWIEMLPNGAAIAAARQIRTLAPVLSPMSACATGLWAIAQGCELIHLGQCERVIAGAVEAPITPLTLAGFGKMGALAQTGVYPFDRDREGFALGEGGAVLVLETAERARQRAARVYGQILGFGLTADGYHVSAPEPGAQTAIAAVQQCLGRSGLTPADIDYIHAHGTATHLNDRNEAHLIQTVFPQGVPVSSTKGAMGHTIGASGALGVALCLMALRHQVLPSCVGLKASEFDLDLITTTRPAQVQRTLCFSFGFGGQNAAIAIGAAPLQVPGRQDTSTLRHW